MKWLRKLKKLFFEDVGLSLGALASVAAAWLVPSAALRGALLLGLLILTLALSIKPEKP